MQIFIDGEISAWNYDSDYSLEQVIIDINDKISMERNRIISDIKIDEFDASLDTNLTWDNLPIGKIFKISLHTQHVYDNLRDQFSTAIKKNSELKKSIKIIIDDLNSENIEKAMISFQDGIESLIWIFNLIKQYEAAGIYVLDKILVGDKSFNDFITEFNNTLSELLGSMENKDITLMNDFLEYELEPSLKNIGDLLIYIKEQIPSSEE